MDTLSWTVDDIELLPEDGSRYEVIEGELSVSKQPDIEHQIVGTKIASLLEVWSNQTRLGIVVATPGVVLTPTSAVVPDVAWMSNERFKTARHPDGKLHLCPELVVEILSPGAENRRRDSEAKLKLYSIYGADDYWIVDWQERRVEVYQRENARLRLAKTLMRDDVLTTELLPGFRCDIAQFFVNV